MPHSRPVATLAKLVLAAMLLYWLCEGLIARVIPRQNDNEIRFSYWGGADDHALWSAIIDDFQRQNPDTHVREEWLPLSGYSTKLDQQFLAGDAPDVMLFQDEPFPRYADQFADLNTLIAADSDGRATLDDAWPTSKNLFNKGDSIRGVPVSGGCVLLFCNLSAFERASRARGRDITPPDGEWMLDEFATLCGDLTIDDNGDGQIDQFGLYQPHWVYYLPFIWACGAELTDPSGTKWTLAGPAALRAFQLYSALRHDRRATPSPAEFAGQNSDTTFLSGRVALCVNGPWYLAFLRETTLRFAVVPFPTGPGGNKTRATWDALCISAKSNPIRRNKAWRFIKYALSDESQLRFARLQRAIPARRSLASEHVRLGGGPGSPADVFVRAMHDARTQPITPGWTAMHRALTTHMTSMLLDGPNRKTPAQALLALEKDKLVTEGVPLP